MNIFRIQIICLVLFGMYYVNSYAQSKIDQDLISPTTTNFEYPQSVFVDSYNGNIWVTDFSNNRVMRFDVSLLEGIDQGHSSNFPGTYFLSQNYPNPFNPSTRISFSVKKTSHASLTVCNILGQTVSILFNETASANKVYSIDFDGRNLSSGIYLYLLRTPNGIEVKKMCLLK